LFTYWRFAARADALSDDTATMPTGARHTLTTYLLGVGKRRVVKITVVNPEGTTSNALTLYVSDLEITTATLADATVGSQYSASQSASGGTGGESWSRVSGPDWVVVSKTGLISGTPKTAATGALLVEVTDKTGASASKSLPIKSVSLVTHVCKGNYQGGPLHARSRRRTGRAEVHRKPEVGRG